MFGRRKLTFSVRRTSKAAAVALLVVASLITTAGAAQAQSARRPVSLTAIAFAGTRAGEVHDTATISGATNPTGTVTFMLFGPNDDTCSRPPVFTDVQPVMGAGTAPATVASGHTILPVQGVYHFVASYSGDAVHAPAGPTACGDPDQAVGFGSSSFAFSAEASPGAPVGGTISDVATLATSSNPTGTITFSLFGPDALSCSGTPVFTSVTPVTGNGIYRSAGYRPTRSGSYRWLATYSGDTDDPQAITACDDPRQRVEVAPSTAACVGLTPGRTAFDQLRTFQDALAPYLARRGPIASGDPRSAAVALQRELAALRRGCS